MAVSATTLPENGGCNRVCLLLLPNPYLDMGFLFWVFSFFLPSCLPAFLCPGPSVLSWSYLSSCFSLPSANAGLTGIL